MAVFSVLLILLLCVFLQGLIYKKRWHKNIGLSLHFSAPVATEGERLFLIETVENQKFLPLPWLSVKFQMSRHLLFEDRENAQISDDFYRNDLFNLRTYQRVTRKLRFTCGKRGVYRVKSAEIISGDILARHKFTEPVPCGSAVLTVYPRTVRLDDALASAAHRRFLGDILTKRFIQPDPFTFRGIREYQPTDSLRSVNFNATAKTGELMVNVPHFTVTQEVALMLNLEPYSAFPREDVCEYAISLAASLAEFYLDSGIPVSLATNGQGKTGDGGTLSLFAESGAGQNHLATIHEALAHISLPLGVSTSGAELLRETRLSREAKRRAGREPSYIFISTNHDGETQAAFNELRSRKYGADALWIIPVHQGLAVSVPLGERVVRAEAGYKDIGGVNA
jgi:uncharacterized protein (DUF58 family)